MYRNSGTFNDKHRDRCVAAVSYICEVSPIGSSSSTTTESITVGQINSRCMACLCLSVQGVPLHRPAVVIMHWLFNRSGCKAGDVPRVIPLIEQDSSEENAGEARIERRQSKELDKGNEAWVFVLIVR